MKTSFSLFVVAAVVLCHCVDRCNSSSTITGTTLGTVTTRKQQSRGFRRNILPSQLDEQNNENVWDKQQQEEEEKEGDASTQELSTAAVGDGTATMPSEVFNLIKCVAGASVFSLPARVVTAFGATTSGFSLGATVICLMASLSSYGFGLLGRICTYTRSSSYQDAWSKSISKKTAWIPSLSLLLVTFGSMIAFSIVLADMMSNLFRGIGDSIVPAVLMSRTGALVFTMLFILLPLCLKHEIKALTSFSVVGVGGLFYTAFAMTIRYLQGAYHQEGGEFHNFFLQQQQESSLSSSSSSSASSYSPFVAISLLMSALATGYNGHFGAPQFHAELKNNTISRFCTMAAMSYATIVVLYLIIVKVGISTFGDQTAHFVMYNYSPHDKLMSVASLGIMLSVLFAFPHCFLGLRKGLLDALEQNSKWIQQKRENKWFHSILSISLLGIVTVLGLSLKNVATVMAFNGATYGNAISFVFPALMFWNCAQKMPHLKRELPLVALLGGVGMVVGTISTFYILQGVF